jgi:hypothetical protein
MMIHEVDGTPTLAVKTSQSLNNVHGDPDQQTPEQSAQSKVQAIPSQKLS